MKWLLGIDQLVVEQIKVGADNFSYLIYDPGSGEGAIVDPGIDSSEALEKAERMGLDLKYVINTHHHVDHTGDNSKVMERTGAKLVASEEASGQLIQPVDIEVGDESVLDLGDMNLRFLKTPGHTKDGICIIVDDMCLLTGDTLFIGDCGRCDLSGSSIDDMFRSLQKLKELDMSLIIYPGHDYGPMPFDTLGNQVRSNKAMQAKSAEELSDL